MTIEMNVVMPDAAEDFVSLGLQKLQNHACTINCLQNRI